VKHRFAEVLIKRTLDNRTTYGSGYKLHQDITEYTH